MQVDRMNVLHILDWNFLFLMETTAILLLD